MVTTLHQFDVIPDIQHYTDMRLLFIITITIHTNEKENNDGSTMRAQTQHQWNRRNIGMNWYQQDF